MSFKKVSVIIPSYNSINLLEETLDSVINQTYQNIEVIIVDDHSVDGSYELAKTFESDTVKVFRNTGEGACSARNYGFRMSHGDYIQFLDADDLLSSDKIEKQVKLLDEYEEGSIASGIWGRFFNDRNDVKWSNQKVNKDFKPAHLWLLESWKGGGMGQTAIWLTPRTLIEKAGDWNEVLKINQDGEFFSRVLMHGKQVICCEEAKVYYRSGNSNSVSQNQKYSREKAESLLLSYQLYLEHAKDFNFATDLKPGIAQNFLEFIYQFYGQFSDLVAKAEEAFYDLGYQKMWPVGGLKFKKLASILGFKSTLKLRKFLS